MIAVEDTGTGIPAEQLPYVFEKFRQVDGSSTRKVGGTGLGLAIVKKIVDDHGGAIDWTSGPEGTTFRIRLPRSRPGGETWPPPMGAPEPVAS